MPCNCPDDKSIPPILRSGCAYLMHSGGPASSIFRLVEQAIPNMELTHGRPTVHADGSLEFPGTPPVIPGYRPESSRLYPAWPLCTLRMLKVELVDGMLCIAGLCGNPATGQFSHEVTPDQCQSCQIRWVQP